MKIAIGCDHAGYEYKEYLKKVLLKENHEVSDQGTYGLDSVDYPDFVHPTATLVANKQADFGILICGSGNGVCITANKYKQVRAALCWNTELAILARQHNDANMICIPARFVGKIKAKNMILAFIKSAFEGGRHARRVDKIPSC